MPKLLFPWIWPICIRSDDDESMRNTLWSSFRIKTLEERARRLTILLLRDSPALNEMSYHEWFSLERPLILLNIYFLL